MQKKLFGAILVLCLLLGMLMALPVAAADNVVEIATADDLLKLMNYDSDLSKAETNADGSAKWALDGNYKLTADIDLTKKTVALEQKPIGTHPDTAIFTGTFDGDGHTIKGVAIDVAASYTGFFGTAGRGAIIKNLTLEGSVTNTKNATGGLVGYGRNTLTIQSCVTNVTVNGSARAAGILGGYDAMEKNATLTITKCTNNGNVTGTLYDAKTCTGAQPAGIVGRIINTKDGAEFTLLIDECTNNGTITGPKQCGGIIGDIEPQAKATIQIKNCANNGTVTVPKPASSGEYVGGIFSYFKITGADVSVTIENCANSGNISAFQYPGGIGGLFDVTTDGTTNVSIISCTNTGTISGKSFVGGIFSRVNTNAQSTATTLGTLSISKCGNAGAVTIGKANNYAYVGGIVGMVHAEDEKIVISECYNTGKVTGNSASYSATGGIVGYLRNYYVEGKTTVENCYNSGIVTSDSGEVGGIIGFTFSEADSKTQADMKKSYVRNCVNDYEISGASTAQDNIIGDSTYADVTNCYYIDDSDNSITGLDTEIWVVGTTRVELKILHNKHFYETTTAGKHKCPCGETAEVDCTYVDYACKYCGYEMPVATLTLQVNDPFDGTITLGDVPTTAKVSLDTTDLTVSYDAATDTWTASGYALTGDDAEHFTLGDAADGITVTPKDEDIITVTVVGGTASNTKFYKVQNVSVTVTADDPAEGEEFAGWIIGDATEATETANPYTFTVTENITLTATYQAASEDPDPGEEDPTPETPKSSSNNNVALALAIVCRNNQKCVVTYKSTGANDHVSATVKKGTALQMPEVPTKDGYTFIGWYKDINGTKPFDFNSKITGSVSIYAKWVKN